jgi:hypothetical protein
VKPVFFRPVMFGTPRLVPNNAVFNFAPITQFGTPRVGFIPVTVEASGFSQSRFGVPSLRNLTITEHSAVRVFGFSIGTFGIPASPHNVSVTAVGFATTRFGEPTWVENRFVTGEVLTRFGNPSIRADQIQTATGYNPTLFGMPTALSLVAESLRIGVFGTPSAENFVARWMVRTTFGTPSTFSSAQIVRGFSTTRFGQPKRTTGSLCNASGFFETRFGYAVSRPVFPALHIWPQVRFGTPISKRFI